MKGIDGVWDSERLDFPPGGVIGYGNMTAFEVGLITDTNGNGVIDQTMSSIPLTKDNPADQLRLTQLTRGMARLDWEDIIQAPNGDFNDYSVILEARQCSQFPLGAGPATNDWGYPAQIKCVDDCYHPDSVYCDPEEVGVVLSSGVQNSPPELVFEASATIDLADSELDNPPFREPRGRLMHVTVGAYFDPMIDFDGFDGRAAICPRLVFDLGSLAPGEVASETRVTYGSTIDAMNECTNVVPSGEPICNAPLGASNEMTLSLAREQYYDEGCPGNGSRKPPGDGFEIETGSEPDACGDSDSFVAHFETYEVSLSALDSALSSAGISLPTPMADLTVSQIRDAIMGLEISTVMNADDSNGLVSSFHCPSGLNMDLRSVHASARLSSYFMLTAHPSHHAGLMVGARD